MVNAENLFSKPAANPQKIGFNCVAGDLGKWAARFRLAKSFQGIDTGKEYNTSQTPSHYGCIIHMFLVFSAFEQYCRCLGVQIYDEASLKPLQDAIGQAPVIAKIRACDDKYKYFTFVREKLDKQNMQNALQGFIDGGNVNVSFLGRCGRHIFAHGHMAAGSVGIDEASMDTLSTCITSFLLDAMDLDFDTKIAAL